MQIFTEQDTLAVLLQQADQDGAVAIRRTDGQIYTLTTQAAPQTDRSPLDIPGVDTGLTTEEIIELIHEGRGNHRW